MDQELDVLLDILEAGNLRDFYRMISETEWSWFVPHMQGRAEIKYPWVFVAGPLGLAVEVSTCLRSLGNERDRGMGHVLSMGRLRRVLHQFHQIPSMKHVGLNTVDYARAVVTAAEHVGNLDPNGTISVRDDVRRLMTSYVLSSVDTSWCLVKKVARFTQERQHYVGNRSWYPLYHTPCIWRWNKKTKVELYWSTDYTSSSGGECSLSLHLSHTTPEGMNVPTECVFTMGIRREPSVKGKLVNSTMTPSDLFRCEDLFLGEDFAPYLPDDALTSLISMAKGMGAYVDWHGLRGWRDRMPESKQPPPPTWLSVWRDLEEG
jgi:hypothetical protein